MKTTLQILEEARALIAKPDNWCRGHFKTKLMDEYAYCVRGALHEATCGDAFNEVVHDDDPVGAAIWNALPAEHREYSASRGYSGILDCHVGCDVPNYNNHIATHADILALFDRAIARQRGIDAMAQQPVKETVCA